MIDVSLFGGPGGWCEGARPLGIHPIGIEIDPWACATRAAAGHQTIRQDVRTLTVREGTVRGLIASPPCPEFSAANSNRRGLDSEEGMLTMEPLRLIRECRPEWVAMEQVPGVLGIWADVYRPALEGLGYSCSARILCAADYGVPQERYRAILIASRTRRVVWPTQTHTPLPSMFGEPPWVTFGEAMCIADRFRLSHTTHERVLIDTDRPSPTVAGHRAPRWSFGVLTTGRGTNRLGPLGQTRTVDAPAPTVGGSSGQLAYIPEWAEKRPSTTVMSDTRVWPPGHKVTPADIKAGRDHLYTTRAGLTAVRLQPWQLGVLQSFPADYPWQGNKTNQCRQIGNAIPVLMARAILSALTS
jgi:DNA (cytosine-5)-methyltransferase 1